MEWTKSYLLGEKVGRILLLRFKNLKKKNKQQPIFFLLMWFLRLSFSLFFFPPTFSFLSKIYVQYSQSCILLFYLLSIVLQMYYDFVKYWSYSWSRHIEHDLGKNEYCLEHSNKTEIDPPIIHICISKYPKLKIEAASYSSI